MRKGRRGCLRLGQIAGPWPCPTCSVLGLEPARQGRIRILSSGVPPRRRRAFHVRSGNFPVYTVSFADVYWGVPAASVVCHQSGRGHDQTQGQQDARDRPRVAPDGAMDRNRIRHCSPRGAHCPPAPTGTGVAGRERAPNERPGRSDSRCSSGPIANDGSPCAPGGMDLTDAGGGGVRCAAPARRGEKAQSYGPDRGCRGETCPSAAAGCR